MVKHIVIYNFFEKSEEVIQKTKEVLLSMKGVVPEVIDIEVGENFLESDRSYDFALIVTLEDREALTRYQKNAYHEDIIKKYMNSVMKESKSVDYEI